MPFSTKAGHHPYPATAERLLRAVGLIGTVRREYPDQLFFLNSRDLKYRLDQFQEYFNEDRAEVGIDADLRNRRADEIESG